MKKLWLFIIPVVVFILTGCIKDPAHVGIPKIPGIETTDHVFGNLDSAQVVIITCMDSRSPWCAIHKETVEQVVSNYHGKVAWVYKHFEQDMYLPSPWIRERSVFLAMEYIANQRGNTAFFQSVDSFYLSVNNSHDRISRVLESFSIDSTTFWNYPYDPRSMAKLKSDSSYVTKLGTTTLPWTVLCSKNGPSDQFGGAISASEMKTRIETLF